MNQEWIIRGVGYNKTWPSNDRNGSYYDGSNNGWDKGSIITISLNLDCGIVEYSCDGKKLKEDKLIKTAAPFYFALCIKSDDKCGVFESELSLICMYININICLVVVSALISHF